MKVSMVYSCIPMFSGWFVDPYADLRRHVRTDQLHELRAVAVRGHVHFLSAVPALQET